MPVCEFLAQHTLHRRPKAHYIDSDVHSNSFTIAVNDRNGQLLFEGQHPASERHLRQLAPAGLALAPLAMSAFAGRRLPQPGADQGLAQTLMGQMQAMRQGELLGRQSGAEVGIALADQFHRLLHLSGVQPAVRRLPAEAMHQTGIALLAVASAQPADLLGAQAQDFCRLQACHVALLELLEDLGVVAFLLAHQ